MDKKLSGPPAQTDRPDAQQSELTLEYRQAYERWKSVVAVAQKPAAQRMSREEVHERR